MGNGTGLLGYNLATQSALIVKQPGNTNIYYIFTVPHQGFDGLHYSIVDMTLAAGMGSVTVKNVLLYTPTTEKLTATKHCNGTDVWILSHRWQSGDFMAYLLTASGVSANPVISTVGAVHQLPQGMYEGQIKVSPNGLKLGVSIYNNQVELFDFSASTGVVSSPVVLTNTAIGAYYGCEFSPDGTKFYANNLTQLYQWDLSSGSPTAIYNSVSVISNTNGIGSMQLAPDGKIYVARIQSQSLGIINNPNATGAACNFVFNAMSIVPATSKWGLPGFMTNSFRVKAPFTSYTVSCQQVQFSAPQGASSVAWNFGDPASAATNTSIVFNPAHLYTSVGVYTTQVIVNYPCFSDTLNQVITISALTPTISLAVSNTLICRGQTATLIAGGASTYSWSSGSTNTSVVVSPTVNTVYNLSGINSGTCAATRSATIYVVNVPLALSPLSQTICTGKSSTIAVTGANSYSWNTGSTNTLISVSPTITTTYTATGTEQTNSCTASQTATIVVFKCLSVDRRVLNDASLRVYPNPSNGKLFIEAGFALTILVYDCMGKMVVEERIDAGTHTLDLGKTAGGIYLLRALHGEETREIKIIKAD